MKRILITALMALVAVLPLTAQQNLTNPALTTTTTAAVTRDATVIPMTAVSGTISVAGQPATTRALQAGDGLYIDGEYLSVMPTYVSGLQVPVTRGLLGTTAKAHVSGATVVYGPPGIFSVTDPGAGSSSCVSGQQQPAPFLVLINVVTGNAWLCRQTSPTVRVWVGTNSRQLTYNSLTVR